MDKSRRKALGGLIFALGLIVMLIGAMTNLYEVKIGVIIMLAIWFLGGALAALIFGGEEEPTDQSKS